MMTQYGLISLLTRGLPLGLTLGVLTNRSQTMKHEIRTFQVTGMHCGGCAGKIRRRLAEISGVHDGDVDVASGRAAEAQHGGAGGEATAAIAGAGGDA